MLPCLERLLGRVTTVQNITHCSGAPPTCQALCWVLPQQTGRVSLLTEPAEKAVFPSRASPVPRPVIEALPVDLLHSEAMPCSGLPSPDTDCGQAHTGATATTPNPAASLVQMQTSLHAHFLRVPSGQAQEGLIKMTKTRAHLWQFPQWPGPLSVNYTHTILPCAYPFVVI